MSNTIKVGRVEFTDEKDIENNGGYPNLDVELYYSLGGYGGLDWTMRPRGYRLDITPCRVSGGVKSSSIGGPRSGGFITIEQTQRKSAKRMQQLADRVDLAKVRELWLARDNNALIAYAKSLAA